LPGCIKTAKIECVAALIFCRKNGYEPVIARGPGNARSQVRALSARQHVRHALAARVIGRSLQAPILALLVLWACCHAALVCRALPWAYDPPPCSDSRATDKHESREVAGLVLAVESNRITLQPADGQTVTLITFEDYRDRVSIGAKVHAWYYPQDNGDGVLKSLDYPGANLSVPAGQIDSQIHRILLLPSSQVPDADGFFDIMREYLHTTMGWYIAPQYLADEVRRRAARGNSTLDAMDASGHFDLNRYLGQAQGPMALMASESRSDAVLEVNVSQVEAPVNRMVASWDGVEESVSGPTVRTLAKFSLFSHKGEVPAATVELKLWDANGKLLWRNQRGLAVLEVVEGKSNHLRERPLPEFLMNSQAVQSWLAAAFESIHPNLAPDASSGK
jgi:hypothetical protein